MLLQVLCEKYIRLISKWISWSKHLTTKLVSLKNIYTNLYQNHVIRCQNIITDNVTRSLATNFYLPWRAASTPINSKRRVDTQTSTVQLITRMSCCRAGKLRVLTVILDMSRSTLLSRFGACFCDSYWLSETNASCGTNQPWHCLLTVSTCNGASLILSHMFEHG